MGSKISKSIFERSSLSFKEEPVPEGSLERIVDAEEVTNSNSPTLNTAVLKEVYGLIDAIKAGRLDARADLSGTSGADREMLEGINEMLDAVIGPLNVAAEYIDRISKGDIPEKITDEYKGDFNEIKNNLNQCIDAINLMVSDGLLLVEAMQEGKLDTRTDASRHAGSFREIIEGFNNTMDAVIGPLNVAAEYIDRISKGDIPEKITDEYKGDFNEIKNNLNMLIDAMNNVSYVAQEIANGNLMVEVKERSAQDALMKALTNMINTINLMVSDSLQLGEAMQEGKLDTRIDASRHAGSFREIIEGFNNTMDAVIGPLNVAAEYIDRISKGDIPEKITDEYKGDFNEIKNNLNMLIDAMNGLINEAARMAEAAAQGQLDVRGDVSKYQGVWATVVKGLNDTAENMIVPMRDIGSVLDRMAAGELKARVINDYKGDYNVLKVACNELGEQLQGVQEVLEELQNAAVSGQLDARGDAGRFKGEIAGMVQGLNDVLDAVIGPLNVAAEYIDRISKGDIPEKITDEYKGDFNEIKNNLNLLIDAMNEVTNAAQEIARGNLMLEVKERSAQDALMKAMAAMVDNLRNIAIGLRNNSANLASSAQQLSASADETSKGANETASNMTEVSASVDQVAQSTQTIRAAADETSREAEQGQQDLETVISQMNDINQATNNAAEVVHQLNDMSSKIGNIVDTITNIADQTNLLALNAAIEAARAGEHGRGFAVVAEEVRKLAEQSAKATSEIQQLISNIQNESTKAVEAMNESLDRVRSGVEIVNNAGQSFGRIISRVRELATQVDEIATATEQVSSAVQDVSSITQESTAAMEEIAASTESLTKLANELQQMAEQFKVDDARVALSMA